ncbi:TadE/TadG family type IV pilus assembly protein [Photobacterium kagoshimensis]|uniref:TadE/TadG family type IV pilus assembly protein n=1 Tax=Photobacterium kagoshimensis TaxID=2910242 RepID=UPI003D124FC5
MHSINRQSGVAAIWFVLIFIALASLTALGVEGARYLNNKARLGDALETASLLLAAQEAKEADDEKNQALVTKVARSYLPDAEAKLPELKIYYKSGEENITIDKQERKVEFLQYKVTASTQHDSWMDMASAPSFDETQNVANFAASKKLAMAGGLNDVVIAVDHSLNMNQDTCTIEFTPGIYHHETARLFVAHQIVNEFVKQIRKPSKGQEKEPVTRGKLGVIPYDSRTSNRLNGPSSSGWGSRSGGRPLCQNHLHFLTASEESKQEGVQVDQGYGEIDWQEYANNTPSEVIEKIGTGKSAAYFVNETYHKASNKSEVYNWLPDADRHIDYSDSVRYMFDLNNRQAEFIRNDNLYNSGGNKICRGNFRTISLADKDLNGDRFSYEGMAEDPFSREVNKFTSNSSRTYDVSGGKVSYLGAWSASYQGFLQAAKELHQHGDRDKPGLLLLIVGGVDSPNSKENPEVKYNNEIKGSTEVRNDLIFQRLADAGMCNKLRKEFPNLTMAAIGVGVDPKSYPGFSRNADRDWCFDASNIHTIDYKSASGTGTKDKNGVCGYDNVNTGTRHKLTLKGQKDIKGIVDAIVGAAGGPPGAGQHEEIGSIYDRRAK